MNYNKRYFFTVLGLAISLLTGCVETDGMEIMRLNRLVTNYQLENEKANKEKLLLEIWDAFESLPHKDALIEEYELPTSVLEVLMHKTKGVTFRSEVGRWTRAYRVGRFIYVEEFSGGVGKIIDGSPFGRKRQPEDLIVNPMITCLIYDAENGPCIVLRSTEKLAQ